VFLLPGLHQLKIEYNGGDTGDAGGMWSVKVLASSIGAVKCRAMHGAVQYQYGCCVHAVRVTVTASEGTHRVSELVADLFVAFAAFFESLPWECFPHVRG
jgi:hypothetical protein